MTYQASGKHSCDRKELSLKLVNHNLHTVVEDIKVRLVGHLEEI